MSVPESSSVEEPAVSPAPFSESKVLLNDSETYLSPLSAPDVPKIDETNPDMPITQIDPYKEEDYYSSEEENESKYNDEMWQKHRKHVMILTYSGKPVYSLYSDTLSISGLTGVIQAIISRSASVNNDIHYIHTDNYEIYFLIKGPLILTCLYKNIYSQTFIRILLNFLYKQIVFILTDSVFDILMKDPSYDMRSLIGPSSTMINKLIINFFHSPHLMLEGYNILRLENNMRTGLNTLFSNQKHSNLMYGLLLSDNKIISLITKKGIPNLNIMDIQLLFTLIQSTSFSSESSEVWQPLCLSSLDSSGFVNAYVCTLNPSIYLMYIAVDNSPEMFQQCSKLKQLFIDQLNQTSYLSFLSNSIHINSYGVSDIHPMCNKTVYYFIYRNSCGQVTSPIYEGIYSRKSQQSRLYQLFMKSFDSMYVTKAYEYLERTDYEMIYCVRTMSYEVFFSMSPLLSLSEVYSLAQKVIFWIKQNESSLFIMRVPTW